jgi:hypothetical protein
MEPWQRLGNIPDAAMASNETINTESVDANILNIEIGVPDEVWGKVVQYLKPKELKAARLVCQAWKDFVSTEFCHWKMFKR